MSDLFDIMVAPNGARLTKADHSALPISTAEVAETAFQCAQAGATAIHAHVRDHQGAHSLDAGLYRDVVRQISEKTRIRVQFSTEAVGIFDVAAQRKLLLAAPSQDASVALREIERAPEMLTDVYGGADAKGVDIQHIVYDASDLERLLHRRHAGEIPAQTGRVIFVLGRYTKGQVSSPSDLQPYLKALGHEPLKWTVCAFGSQEQACLLAALDQGGNVRIGFENNRIAPDGTTFPDNATSVAALVEAADKRGFQPYRSLS